MCMQWYNPHLLLMRNMYFHGTSRPIERDRTGGGTKFLGPKSVRGTSEASAMLHSANACFLSMLVLHCSH